MLSSFEENGEKRKISNNVKLYGMHVWPLAEIREGEEMVRRERDEPVPFTAEEISLREELRNRPANLPGELFNSLTERECFLLSMWELKERLNGMKARYKEDLAEQRREWERWKEEVKKNEEQEWFQNLSTEQKEEIRAERWQYAWRFLALQNKMLEKWEAGITDIGGMLRFYSNRLRRLNKNP